MGGRGVQWDRWVGGPSMLIVTLYANSIDSPSSGTGTVQSRSSPSLTLNRMCAALLTPTLVLIAAGMRERR